MLSFYELRWERQRAHCLLNLLRALSKDSVIFNTNFAISYPSLTPIGQEYSSLFYHLSVLCVFHIHTIRHCFALPWIGETCNNKDYTYILGVNVKSFYTPAVNLYFAYLCYDIDQFSWNDDLFTIVFLPELLRWSHLLFAISKSCSLEASAGTSILALILPQIWTAISTVVSTHFASSYAGQLCWLSIPPKFCASQISSVMWGANGLSRIRKVLSSLRLMVLVVRNVVDQCHQGCDSSVKLHFFDISADLLDCFYGMRFPAYRNILRCRWGCPGVPIHDQGKRLHPFDGRGGPWSALFKVADEHLVQTHKVSAPYSLRYRLGYNAAAGFNSSSLVFTQNHAMAGTFCVWFRLLTTWDHTGNLCQKRE